MKRRRRHPGELKKSTEAFFQDSRTTSSAHVQRFGGHSTFLERSFFCLDTKERTKEKIKAGEKTAKNFYAELKRIKYAVSSEGRGDEYSFCYTPLRNFLNAIFSQADLKSTGIQEFCRELTSKPVGLRRSFVGFRSEN